MTTPYYSDALVTLWLGDCRGDYHAGMWTPHGVSGDVIIADPPYGETSLVWDRWPEAWPRRLVGARQMWCFGSMRMFLAQRHEFAGWKYSQEVVWEKHNGSSFHADRFRRVHELATHWYRGTWGSLYHETPTTPDAVARTVARGKRRPNHMGHIEKSAYESEDGGPLLMRSVIYCRSEHGHALHPTQKPLGILTPLIEYSCPPGGTVLDPFSGAGSVLLAARLIGRRAIGWEIDERYCEIAANRLAQGSLEFEATS